MFVSVSARLEKMFHRTYEINTQDEKQAKEMAFKQALNDLIPLKKQGFIITDVYTEDFTDWVEEVQSEDSSTPNNE